MKKEFNINNNLLSFIYQEDGNFWYIGYNELYISYIESTINITINDKEPNWENVNKFLHLIISNQFNLQEKIIISNTILKKSFEKLYGNLNLDINLKRHFFSLCNIDYKEFNISGNSIKYILNFNIESKTDKDFFMYDSWECSF